MSEKYLSSDPIQLPGSTNSSSSTPPEKNFESDAPSCVDSAMHRKKTVRLASKKTIDLSRVSMLQSREKSMTLEERDKLPGVIAPPDNWWMSLLVWTGTVGEAIWFRVGFVILITIALLIFAQFDYTIPSFSAQPHTLVGLPMGLLLVFRTNNAYDRFWEGRKAWGTIVINARIFGRYLATTHAVHRTGDSFSALYLAFALALKHRLRASHNSDEEYEELRNELKPRTLEMVLKVNNRPVALTRLMTEFILDKVTYGEISPHLLAPMQSLLGECVASATACERIINTPLPLPYLIQIRQLVFLYTATLPFVTEGLFRNWAALFATFLLAFGLFGIEEAGKIIENPFGDDASDLPLESYCDSVELELKQIFGFSRLVYHSVHSGHEHMAGLFPPDGRARVFPAEICTPTYGEPALRPPSEPVPPQPQDLDYLNDDSEQNGDDYERALENLPISRLAQRLSIEKKAHILATAAISSSSSNSSASNDLKKRK